MKQRNLNNSNRNAKKGNIPTSSMVHKTETKSKSRKKEKSIYEKCPGKGERNMRVDPRKNQIYQKNVRVILIRMHPYLPYWKREKTSVSEKLKKPKGSGGWGGGKNFSGYGRYSSSKT